MIIEHDNCYNISYYPKLYCCTPTDCASNTYLQKSSPLSYNEVHEDSNTLASRTLLE